MLGLAVATAGCHQAAGPIGKTPHSEPAGGRVQFAFDSLDVRPVSTEAFLGKPTVIVFMTTWDLSSQAQIDFLVPMAKKDAGATNYAMVALEEWQDHELVDVYASHFHVNFPVAIAGKGVIEDGPFGELNMVPIVVVLDRGGRLAWKHAGLARPEEIRKALSGL